MRWHVLHPSHICERLLSRSVCAAGGTEGRNAVQALLRLLQGKQRFCRR